VTVHINNTLAYLRLVEAPQSIIDNVAALTTERDALLAALQAMLTFERVILEARPAAVYTIATARAAIAKVQS
jgi:hypothetical protein